MKLFKWERFAYVAIGIAFGVFLNFGIDNADDNAGTASDPLVTLSYMEQQMDAMESRLTDVINQKISTNSAAESTVLFEVIHVPAGTVLYLGASTEFIIRVGEAEIIDPHNIGIPDLTDGDKVDDGETVPIDHHMLVPSNDGRGINVVKDSWIMVKGDYTEIDN